MSDPNDARAALATAAAVLRAQSEPMLVLIGDWLGAGAVGDLLEVLDPEASRRAWLAAAIEHRDRLLREAAAGRWPDLSITARAVLLARQLARYRATAWQRDRIRIENPYPPGELRTVLWQALRLVDRDLSQRHARRILAISAG
jgi:hypothetical protein